MPRAAVLPTDSRNSGLTPECAQKPIAGVKINS